MGEGQEVMVLEAMKMQNSLVTGKSGKVRQDNVIDIYIHINKTCNGI